MNSRIATVLWSPSGFGFLIPQTQRERPLLIVADRPWGRSLWIYRRWFSDSITFRTLSCTVNGQDPFVVGRTLIGSHLYRCIRFDGWSWTCKWRLESGTPSTIAMTVSGSCSNSNNVGRSWIVPTVITCVVVVVIIVIVVIVVIVYVFASPCKKKLKVKDTKDCCVCCITVLLCTNWISVFIMTCSFQTSNLIACIPWIQRSRVRTKRLWAFYRLAGECIFLILFLLFLYNQWMVLGLGQALSK